MRTAAQARGILGSQWDELFPARVLPWAGMRLLLAQSRQEGSWGAFGGLDAWGIWGGENWGAVQAKMGPPCPTGTFEAGDSKPSAEGQKPFRWCFVAYPTPEAGARDFLRHALILRPTALLPLLAGDTWRYAEKLRDTNYYGGFSTTLGEGAEKDARRRWEQIGSYVDMLDHQGAVIDQELGQSHQPPTKKPAFVFGKDVKASGRPISTLIGIATIGIPVILGALK